MNKNNDTAKEKKYNSYRKLERDFDDKNGVFSKSNAERGGYKNDERRL